MTAGDQHMTSGIQSGLVNMSKIRTQKDRPNSMSITLDYRKISRRKIIEKSINFKRNLAVFLALYSKMLMI